MGLPVPGKVLSVFQAPHAAFLTVRWRGAPVTLPSLWWGHAEERSLISGREVDREGRKNPGCMIPASALNHSGPAPTQTKLTISKGRRSTGAEDRTWAITLRVAPKAPHSLGTSVFSSTDWVWLLWGFHLVYHDFIFPGNGTQCNGSHELSLMDYIENVTPQHRGVNARPEDREIPHHISGFRVNRRYWKNHSKFFQFDYHHHLSPCLHVTGSARRCLRQRSLFLSSKPPGFTAVFHLGSFYLILRLSTTPKVTAAEIPGLAHFRDFVFIRFYLKSFSFSSHTIYNITWRKPSFIVFYFP